MIHQILLLGTCPTNILHKQEDQNSLKTQLKLKTIISAD